MSTRTVTPQTCAIADASTAHPSSQQNTCQPAHNKELGIADHCIQMLVLRILVSIIQNLDPPYRLIVCEQAAKTVLTIVTDILLIFVFVGSGTAVTMYPIKVQGRS